MARPFLLFAAALALAGLAVPVAHAQSPLSERLENDRLGAIRSGTYEAPDEMRFTLDRDGNNYLLRVEDSPEVYVLYMQYASLGGRVLKYDSGKTALRVSGWGGLTIYTDKKPDGLPAEWSAGDTPPALPDVSMAAIRKAADDESRHLAYAHGLKVEFAADWASLADDAGLRALCFDAMENAARGLDRFAEMPAGRAALKAHVGVVFMETSGKPIIALKGRQLLVTYNPDKGYIGRASSRAIAHALYTAFSLPRPAGE
jgi:hypothetical protein